MTALISTDGYAAPLLASKNNLVIKAERLGFLSTRDKLKFMAFGTGPSEAPDFRTLHQAFEHYARVTPNATALVHGRHSLSYQELNDNAERLATWLQQNDVREGDAVGLFLTRSIPMVVGMLACLKIGASYIPQHAGVAPAQQLEHIVDVAHVRVVLTLSEHEDSLPGFDKVDVIALDNLMKSATFKQTPIGGKRSHKPDNRCFVLFTSGTTGNPNGVQVTHKNVCNIVMTHPGNLGVKPGMRVGQLLSIAFDMSAWEIYVALCHGATLVIREKVIEHTACNVDVIIATPSILGQIPPEQCREVKTVAVAGEPCPLPLAETWGEFCDFYNACGPTETTIINTAKLFRPGDTLTIGKPTPNNTVYILRDDMTPCNIGEVGEMWAGGDCVTRGYLANATLSEARYRPDPFLGDGHTMFRTRDLGRWTETGELEHLGRTDDQVKVKGFRVELDAVSTILEQLPGCDKAVTIKVDNNHLAAFVTPSTVDERTAIEHVAAHLPYYAVPVRVMTLTSFPLTDRGKVDKALLLETYHLFHGSKEEQA